MNHHGIFCLSWTFLYGLNVAAVAFAAPMISAVSAPAQIGTYEKFEISFQVGGAVAGNLQFPYDPAPPAGIDLGYDKHRGISVDAQFTSPSGEVFRQPAFFFQEYAEANEERGGMKSAWCGQQHEWYYPTGGSSWKVRFAPPTSGVWQFRLSAEDSGGVVTTPPSSFTVTPSGRRGFVRVSRSDSRYFEYDDGALFVSPGLEAGGALDDPLKRNKPILAALEANRIRFVRNWISGLYGAAWPRFLGGRNLYGGYLPRPGILPFRDAAAGRDYMTLYLTYPEGWFDACQFEFWDDHEPVKPNTTYRLVVKYWARNMTGPRVATSPNYGFVAKITPGWPNTCYEPGVGNVVTNYGPNTTGWSTIEGSWNSGANHFLPRVSLTLENVTAGQANVLSVSLKEDLGGGNLGPEIMRESSMEWELAYSDPDFYRFEKYLELAERYGIQLKLVLSDKNDHIYYKLDDDGTFVINGESDNEDGFYGLGRGMNKTRWLQRAYWRYLQARFGYSTSIHSWELTNEGDPFSTRHWELTDELGKFMHCGVFGVAVSGGDGERCSFEHPNRHLVTTSFWHSYPGYSASSGYGFWGNPKYPNVDYADVHAYISTSPASDAERAIMERDAAHFHLWHSREYGGWKFPFPNVRGESGMVPRNGSTDDFDALGLDRDTQGVWYHNFLWSTLDAGALYEIYWYAVPHVWKDGSYDHRPAAIALHNFLETIPLNNGSYRDVEAVTSPAELRVVGQKDLAHGRAHLWLQNKAHTWKNVVDGLPIAPVTGTVRLGGFAASASYTLEWWDTYAAVPSTTREVTAAGPDGVLTIPVSALVTDRALKIRPQGDGVAPAAPANLRMQ